jgi:hypothetical protein
VLKKVKNFEKGVVADPGCVLRARQAVKRNAGCFLDNKSGGSVDGFQIDALWWPSGTVSGVFLKSSCKDVARRI